MQTPMEPLVQLITSGVFERRPGLRAGMIESGIGFFPWMAEDMDFAYRAHHFWVRPVIPDLPSEYLRRHCFRVVPGGPPRRHHRRAGRAGRLLPMGQRLPPPGRGVALLGGVHRTADGGPVRPRPGPRSSAWTRRASSTCPSPAKDPAPRGTHGRGGAAPARWPPAGAPAERAAPGPCREAARRRAHAAEQIRPGAPTGSLPLANAAAFHSATERSTARMALTFSPLRALQRVGRERGGSWMVTRWTRGRREQRR